jgi:perosamine synthetase
MDCELDSYGMSMDAVRAALEADRNIVGVCLAPCYGVPARDTMEILAMCKDRGLWLCEDACETYGAAYSLESEGRESKVPVGSQATLCVLSVRSEKMIGVGEGGAIVGNDTALVAKAKWWCSRAPCRGGGLWRVYEHDAVGQNFRLPEMLAAVGCAAAEMLPLMIERKRAIHEWYMSKFAADPDLQGVKLQKCAGGDEPVWWINAALLPDGYSGEEVGMLLMKDYPDIEIRPGFFPLNKMDIFKSGFNMPCPNTELLYDRLVCLPSSNQLLEPDVDRICKALANSLRQVKKQ